MARQPQHRAPILASRPDPGVEPALPTPATPPMFLVARGAVRPGRCPRTNPQVLQAPARHPPGYRRGFPPLQCLPLLLRATRGRRQTAAASRGQGVPPMRHGPGQPGSAEQMTIDTGDYFLTTSPRLGSTACPTTAKGTADWSRTQHTQPRNPAYGCDTRLRWCSPS